MKLERFFLCLAVASIFLSAAAAFAEDAPAQGGSAAAAAVTVASYGAMSIGGGLPDAPGDDAPPCQVQLYTHGPTWDWTYIWAAEEKKTEKGEGWREYSGKLAVKGEKGKYVRYKERITTTPKGFTIDLEFEFPEAAKIKSCNLSLLMTGKYLAGKKLDIVTDGGIHLTRAVPKKYEKQFIHRDAVSGYSLPEPNGFALTVEPAMYSVVQDNRQYDHDQIEIRFNFVEGKGQAQAGEKHAARFTFEFPEPGAQIDFK